MIIRLPSNSTVLSENRYCFRIPKDFVFGALATCIWCFSNLCLGPLATFCLISSKVNSQHLIFVFLTDFDEASSPKDEADDKYQGTPPSTQSGTQSSSEFGELSPITLANQYGLPGGMTLLDLMATPPERKAKVFKLPELADVQFAPTEKKF